jgi:hypothetical protein
VGPTNFYLAVAHKHQKFKVRRDGETSHAILATGSNINRCKDWRLQAPGYFDRSDRMSTNSLLRRI